MRNSKRMRKVKSKEKQEKEESELRRRRRRKGKKKKKKETGKKEGEERELAHEIYIRSTDTTAGGARAWGRSWQKRPVRPF